MNRPRILVVEDELLVAKDLQNKLEIMGYEVLCTVRTADQAIQRAQELGPDLVLMDIVLEGDTDGVAAANVIRSDLHIPVVYVTAFADKEILDI